MADYSVDIDTAVTAATIAALIEDAERFIDRVADMLAAPPS